MNRYADPAMHSACSRLATCHTLHSLHSELPASETWCHWQDEHTVWPDNEYCPAGHCMHWLASTVAIVPARQTLQLPLPAFETDPRAQLLHLLLPGVAYSPAMQEMHSLFIRAGISPALHGEHSLLPTWDHVPSGQSQQVELISKGRSMSAEVPFATAYVPAWHDTHSACVLEAARPGAQKLHSPLPGSATLPGGQAVQFSLAAAAK